MKEESYSDSTDFYWALIFLVIHLGAFTRPCSTGIFFLPPLKLHSCPSDRSAWFSGKVLSVLLFIQQLTLSDSSGHFYFLLNTSPLERCFFLMLWKVTGDRLAEWLELVREMMSNLFFISYFPALILKILSMIYKLVQSNTYTTKR